MKVLFFTKYTRHGASSRLRTFLYLDYFSAHGIECTVSPFFSDDYLNEVYATKHHNKWESLKSFLRRIRILLSVRQYDFVVIEKELFPYFPAIFEWLLDFFGVKYLADYDDAIFHNYDVSSNPLIRVLLRNKISTVMRHAAVVSAGNAYLASKARTAGAKRIEHIPTVVDVDRYRPKEYTSSEVFTIGWIGSPITHKYLHFLKDVIQELSARYPIRLRLIGANRGIGLPEIEDLVKWDEATEAEEIRKFNVGIMPLEDNIWERGKCGYKLIQYMGSGVPVVGTPIGVNDDLIVDDVNGFKVNTPGEWFAALEKLICGGIQMEQRLGSAGRKLVEEKYSLQVIRKKYTAILQEQN